MKSQTLRDVQIARPPKPLSLISTAALSVITASKFCSRNNKQSYDHVPLFIKFIYKSVTNIYFIHSSMLTNVFMILLKCINHCNPFHKLWKRTLPFFTKWYSRMCLLGLSVHTWKFFADNTFSHWYWHNQHWHNTTYRTLTTLTQRSTHSQHISVTTLTDQQHLTKLRHRLTCLQTTNVRWHKMTYQ